MKLGKLINAFKNADQIMEGIKNNIFKKEHVEAVAHLRWQQCKTCEKLDKEGTECAAPGTQPCCGDCGCSLSLKLRALSSDCPLDKWSALMEEDVEDKVIEQIKGKENGNKEE